MIVRGVLANLYVKTSRDWGGVPSIYSVRVAILAFSGFLRGWSSP